MSHKHKIGDLVRGDHRVLSVHEGYLGRVTICRQELPEERHVYKALKTFLRTDDEVCRQLFERELAYWVGLPPHPNVVQAKDADTIEKVLVLEFVPGPSLQDVARHKPVHPRPFLRWARQVASGLRFLHVENHFLHRDLRPANILIDIEHQLTAKISDLGIGKPFDPTATSHTVIGTFTFMAPEVFQGRTDYRSDIFSFGATLYYLITGEYAVKITTQRMRDVVSPARLVPGVPDDVASFLLRCLERDPDARYPSMDDVVAALEDFREWPADHLPYERCPKHGYPYWAEGSDASCPFCRYEEGFRRAEEALARILEKG